MNRGLQDLTQREKREYFGGMPADQSNISFSTILVVETSSIAILQPNEWPITTIFSLGETFLRNFLTNFVYSTTHQVSDGF
ncbi:MAG: hypothetical protein Q8O99_06270 [bacterium]|nr:hypothetical protein [bacterium]